MKHCIIRRENRYCTQELFVQTQVFVLPWLCTFVSLSLCTRFELWKYYCILNWYMFPQSYMRSTFYILRKVERPVTGSRHWSCWMTHRTLQPIDYFQPILNYIRPRSGLTHFLPRIRHFFNWYITRFLIIHLTLQRLLWNWVA